MPSTRPSLRVVALGLLALFVGVVYLPIIDAPFTFDDYPHIVHHEGAQPDHWGELSRSLSHPATRDRPVARVTFGVNYLMGGLDPTLYHLTNVGIHIGSASLLFALLLALSRAPRSPGWVPKRALTFAALTALVWAVHPVNTQAVSYVVQRMTSLAGLFYLATLWVFVLWRLGRLRTPLAWVLILVCWVLAMGSKMQAASAPAAIWVIEVAFFSGVTRRNLGVGALVMAGGLGTAAVILSDDLVYLFVEHPRYGFSGFERLLTECRVLWHYVSLIVWPDAGRLQIDYVYPASQSLWAPWTTLPALLGLLALTMAAVWAIRCGIGVWPAAGWLLFLVASSVEASFIMLDPIFEHRVYLPGAFLVAGLAAPLFGVRLSESMGVGFRLAALGVIGLLGWQTVERNQLWAQPAKLWTQALEAGAKPGRAKANAGVAVLQKGQLDRAKELLQPGPSETPASTAKETAGSSGSLTSPHRVRIAIVEGRLDAAFEAAREGLQRQPGRASWAFLYGVSAAHLGHDAEAREIAEQLAERTPELPSSAVIHALVDHQNGNTREGIQRLHDWIAGNTGASLPRKNFARLYLGNLLYHAGDTEGAIRVYRGIVDTDPLNWSAWVNLAQVLHATGYVERARAIEAYLAARDVDVETFKSYAQPRELLQP